MSVRVFGQVYASKEDYLEYYYEYEETTVHYVYDDKGNVYKITPELETFGPKLIKRR